MENAPGYKNKTADCLSRLPFVTRKRNNNLLKDEEISINVNQTKENAPCCPVCEVDVTGTKALQWNDTFCIRIAKMMEDPKIRFNDPYVYDSTGLLYHINKENGKEYRATIVPKVLIKTVL